MCNRNRREAFRKRGNYVAKSLEARSEIEVTLDADVIKGLRQKAQDTDWPDYRQAVNQLLRDALRGTSSPSSQTQPSSPEPVEQMVRRVIREEFQNLHASSNKEANPPQHIVHAAPCCAGDEALPDPEVSQKTPSMGLNLLRDVSDEDNTQPRIRCERTESHVSRRESECSEHNVTRRKRVSRRVVRRPE